MEYKRHLMYHYASRVIDERERTCPRVHLLNIRILAIGCNLEFHRRNILETDVQKTRLEFYKIDNLTNRNVSASKKVS